MISQEVMEFVIRDKVPEWRKKPVRFCRQALGFEPDPWQKEALNALRDRSRVAIKSGQGVGKTGVEACALLWFLVCHTDARIVATAPTKQQLYDVLWAEVAKWMANSPILKELLKWTKTYIYMIGNENQWFAVTRTATKPENMQGYHADNMMFIVDEASGVADPIMEAIFGTLTGANNKLLMMGNPTRVTGAFHDAFTTDRSLYHCMTVSARTSPRTTKENIESLDRKYGRNSNVVKVRVDGEFPEQDDDVFIPISWIEQSIATEVTEDTLKALGEYVDDKGQRWKQDPAKIQLAEIGVDCARFGDDKTCIGYRINECCRFYKKANGQDTVWTAAQICNLYRHIKLDLHFNGPVAVKVDDGGVGGGVVDQLRSTKRSDPLYEKMLILPINFGKPISKHRYYYDSTTYMMGVLRDLISPFDEAGNPKRPEVVLPNDSDLVGQLSVRKYAFLSGAKAKVESKKEMKDRGLSSPDEGDCMLLVVLPVRYKKGMRGGSDGTETEISNRR